RLLSFSQNRSSSSYSNSFKVGSLFSSLSLVVTLYGLQSLHSFSAAWPCCLAHSTSSRRVAEHALRVRVRLPDFSTSQSRPPGCEHPTRWSTQPPDERQLTKKPAGLVTRQRWNAS